MAKYYPVYFSEYIDKVCKRLKTYKPSLEVLERFLRQEEHFGGIDKNGKAIILFEDKELEEKIKCNALLVYYMNECESEDDVNIGLYNDFYDTYAIIKWTQNKEVFKVSNNLFKEIEKQPILLKDGFYEELPLDCFCLDLTECEEVNEYFKYLIVSVDAALDGSFHYTVEITGFSDNNDNHWYSWTPIRENVKNKEVTFEELFSNSDKPEYDEDDFSEPKEVAYIRLKEFVIKFLCYMSQNKPDIAWFDDVMEEYVPVSKTRVSEAYSPNSEEIWHMGYENE